MRVGTDFGTAGPLTLMQWARGGDLSLTLDSDDMVSWSESQGCSDTNMIAGTFTRGTAHACPWGEVVCCRMWAGI